MTIICRPPFYDRPHPTRGEPIGSRVLRLLNHGQRVSRGVGEPRDRMTLTAVDAAIVGLDVVNHSRSYEGDSMVRGAQMFFLMLPVHIRY